MKLTTKYTDVDGNTIDIDVYYHIMHGSHFDEEEGPRLDIMKITKANEPTDLIILPEEDNESLISMCWKHANRTI